MAMERGWGWGGGSTVISIYLTLCLTLLYTGPESSQEDARTAATSVTGCLKLQVLLPASGTVQSFRYSIIHNHAFLVITVFYW